MGTRNKSILAAIAPAVTLITRGYAPKPTLLRFWVDAEPVLGTRLRAMIGEAFVLVTVLAAVVIFGDDSRVIYHKLDLAGNSEKSPVRKQVPEVVHDDARQADAGWPTSVT
jgi:hypothetical protein